MHRLSLTVIDAAAVAMPAALQLGGSPAPRLAAARRQGPRPPPWLRFGWGGGARRGLLCSAEAARRGGDGDDAEAEVEEARRGGGGRAATERRMRGGAAAAVVGTSVELLAIPGVGPRNLRKLVDNGFEGVAQLKQLYRDKVRVLVFRLLLVCVNESLHPQQHFDHRHINSLLNNHPKWPHFKDSYTCVPLGFLFWLVTLIVYYIIRCSTLFMVSVLHCTSQKVGSHVVHTYRDSMLAVDVMAVILKSQGILSLLTRN